MRDSFVLREVIDSESVFIHFHPIVSLKEGTIVGLEALARGRNLRTGGVISPLDLICRAEEEGLALELDRLCRKKALEGFRDLPDSRNILLFVNLNASIIDVRTAGSGHFLSMVKSLGIPSERVAIEVVESRVADPRLLQDFAARYREAGFLVVIDDFGADHSNLERLIQVRPDIIKIDRNIISGIDKDHYKQSVMKSISDLSRMIGSLSLAEGVETLGELHACYQLGADLFQGYYFCRPSADFPGLSRDTRLVIEGAVASVEALLKETIRRRNEENRNFEEITRRIVRSLRNHEAEDMEHRFARFLEAYPNIECIYLLDEAGRQITETVCSSGMRRGESNRHSLFQPAPRNTDHSLKNYYYYIKNLDIRRYFTDPYLSLASGHLCRTMAVTLDGPAGRNRILCIDFLSIEQIGGTGYGI